MKREPYTFSPDRYEAQLTAIIGELLDLDQIDKEAYERVIRRYPKDGHGFFSKSDVIRGYRYLTSKHGWQLAADRFVEKIRMKPVRTQSGVAPVTVLTKPFPCPGRCVFCPSDVRMPKSYLSSEPGAQRAAQHQFDPYRQTLSRLVTYHNIGHPTDKIELIILGGTWSSYPEEFQIWFVQRCFDAMNDFYPSDSSPATDRPDPVVDYRDNDERIDGTRLDRTYNDAVLDFASLQLDESATESSSWKKLRQAQGLNELAKARCVGLVVESRPDHLTLDEVVRMRRLGATKVQIGYQSLSDGVLRLNKRGHDVAATRRAMLLLRGAGFKIHAHWMPNLLGSSPQRDLEDFDRIFGDPAFRPDELKIYPCSLVESAELMSYYEAGLWRPYDTAELLEVVQQCLRKTPNYCRVTRVIRDIPGTEIVAGSRVTNLREIAETELIKTGHRGSDIRSREIRHRRIDPESLELRHTRFATTLGDEVFLELVTPEDRLAAFLRLSLPTQPVRISEIADSSMIREVHVYGQLAPIGQRRDTRSQHLGLGARLINTAAEMAADEGFADLAVISAIGTRQYYRDQGFTDGELYQHRQPG